ncbi:unnamed protein product [Rhizophagus irregularis]|nr:unnamed protein product [Rhizophagus irregularis]
MTDKIKIHAITEGFILVTYLCNPSSNGDTCGSVIDWKGFERSTITFESSLKKSLGLFMDLQIEIGAVSVISSKT